MLALSGSSDSIVDWIVVELRDSTNSGHVVGSTAALIQKDGDIVGTDGTSNPRVLGVQT